MSKPAARDGLGAREIGGTRLERLEGRARFEDACRQLRRAIERWGEVAKAERVRVGHAYLRLEQPVGSDVDPVIWLHTQEVLPRHYWQSADSDFAFASSGLCDQQRGNDFGIVDELLERATSGTGDVDLRLLITSRFDVTEKPKEDWGEFGNVSAVLPLIELRRDRGGVVLAANLRIEAGRGVLESQARQAFEALAAGERAGDLSASLSRVALRGLEAADDSARDGWEIGVRKILAEIDAGRLLKCVLARRVTYSCVGVSPLALLQAAIERHPRTYRFLVQPSTNRAFLGASPERLYQRRGSAIASEAVAGTRPRGVNRLEDERLGRDLMASSKDGVEHESVLTHVAERLGTICEQVEVDAGPHLYRLPDLQHLRTAVRGRLRAGRRDAEVLSALHPTPAVCGQPMERARALLQGEESFDRGLYGGLVGLVGREDAEVAVAIRSALVHGDEVHLFAGAGIVAGSRPADEWEETICKLRAMAALLEG